MIIKEKYADLFVITSPKNKVNASSQNICTSLVASNPTKTPLIGEATVQP
jgi:hypothetical protein